MLRPPDVALDILKERGVPLDRQVFTWRDLVREPVHKLESDAFTRVRILLMRGVEAFALRVAHGLGWAEGDLRLVLARIARVEKHQQTLVSGLLPPDLSPLEAAIASEQAAIEITASVAEHEPDAYLAQVYRFGLLEHVDHLHRFAALFRQLEGGDARTILQGHTDVRPGRPTVAEHRAPEDDLRRPYDRRTADPLSKLHALTITACELQNEDDYTNVGPHFADPGARELFAEISAIEEQHATQYGSLLDPDESAIERLLLVQAMEVYNYYGCAEQEGDARVRAIWHRFVDYELGQLHALVERYQASEGRDAAALLPATLPRPIAFTSHRELVEQTLAREVHLRARGILFIDRSEELPGSPSVVYRQQLNSEGSPSERVTGDARAPAAQPSAGHR